MAGIQSSTVAIMAVFVLSMLAPAVFSQSTCVSKLTSCANFLNNSHPPDSCCSPLKDAVQNDLACLCSIWESPEILKAFKINVTQALQLSVNCGASSDTSLCSKAGAPANSTPGNAANNGVSMLGMSGLLGLCLFWWSLVA